MLRQTCLALLLPSAALAQDLADSAAVVAFRDRPCAEVIDVIYVEEASGLSLAETIGLASRVNLYLGFLIGFDTAHGGLQGESASTLQRLRLACEADPGVPALDLLDAFVAERSGATPD